MILLTIAMILILALAGVCICCFCTCFYAPNKKPKDPYGKLHGEQFLEVQEHIYASTRRMEDVPFEAVQIQSFDGLTLCGRYYHLNDGAPVQIMFHGYRSMALRDCAGGFSLARKLGMNVLAVDQRAHGNSGGHVITFGIWERRDCISWIRYVNERFGNKTPIILSGLSMGAATVIMATALPMPNNVQCVLADSPYAAPAEIIKKVCRDSGIPDNLAYPFIRFAARVMGGFNLEQASAIVAAGVSPVPILLLHGEEDHFVPCQMSRDIHMVSSGTTKLKTFAEAGHGLSYIMEPKLYEEAVIDFLKQFSALEEYVNANKEEAL